MDIRSSQEALAHDDFAGPASATRGSRSREADPCDGTPDQPNATIINKPTDWTTQGFTSHSTQNRWFWRWSLQFPATFLAGMDN